MSRAARIIPTYRNRSARSAQSIAFSWRIRALGILVAVLVFCFYALQLDARLNILPGVVVGRLDVVGWSRPVAGDRMPGRPDWVLRPLAILFPENGSPRLVFTIFLPEVFDPLNELRPGDPGPIRLEDALGVQAPPLKSAESSSPPPLWEFRYAGLGRRVVTGFRRL